MAAGYGNPQQYGGNFNVQAGGSGGQVYNPAAPTPAAPVAAAPAPVAAAPAANPGFQGAQSTGGGKGGAKH